MTSRFALNRLSRLVPALVLAVFLLPHFIFAQGSPSERTFQKSASAVDKALQQVHSSIGGRLPVLDGFVDTDQPLDSYSRGYYQCSVQVAPVSPSGTLVRVTAKITAWHAGSGATQGGYRVLHSNGRLEADFLDRLNHALGGTASAQNSPAAPSSALPAEIAPSEALPRETAPTKAAPSPPSAAVPEPTAANRSGSSKPAMVVSVPAVSLPPGVVLPPYNPSTSMSSSSMSEDLMSPRQRLEDAQQRKDLIANIQGLEEIQRNQIHPTNLAVVKHAGTPVLSKPASSAPAIFEADAGDEFEILGNQGNWIHVRIAGQSRGWIKRTGLDLPEAAQSSKSTEDLNRSETPAFHISHEETKPFPGQWKPLHGKMVRIIWVEPSAGSATSSAYVKRSFAKSVFSKAYQETASTTQPLAGVVIVFDSADGGQISTTLATLKEWRSGGLPEASFWKRCALDPPDLLQESSTVTGGNR
ncbi:MAG: SH3 domain-containing protein [Acidobacteriaceae bacterium]